MGHKVRNNEAVKLAAVALFVFLVPSNACAFVSHDYPATFVNEMARVYFLFSSLLVLAAMTQKLLYRDKRWRHFFVSLSLFIIWDIVVFAGQIAEQGLDPSLTIGSLEGWHYFKRAIVLHGHEYVFYFAKFDYILLNFAALFFYTGLRRHLKEDDRPQSRAAAVLPLLPIFIVETGGAVTFFILSLLSLTTSLRLSRRDKTNILWNYMIWLSSAFLIFSISRFAGHVLQHILLASGHSQVWQNMAPISGSFNILTFVLLGSVSLFFIKTYDAHMKLLKDKLVIENINSELTELNQELENIVTERTMSLMALTVADKVRNPVAMIGILCRRVLSKKEDFAHLNSVIDECEKLQNIVGDFENFLRTKKSMFKYEDVNEIIRSVVSVIETDAVTKKIDLVSNLADGPLKVNAQKSLLRVAIFHVIENAVDATPEGGRITLDSSRINDDIVIAISDTGSGIKKEDMDSIFDVFYSTKRSGFGMGLPLVKQIIEEHLGKITIESEEGKGTMVVIKLPTRWKQEEKD
ncbi:MAG: sensor histidine kinase [Dissulfurispiraceae bacterium]